MQPISNPSSFRLEAMWQRVCAVCQKPTRFHAHHVIERKWLKSRGLPQWDTRNALRLCALQQGKNCHMQHPTRRKIKTTELTDDNIEYAFEVMGAAGGDYLRRYYDDSSPDPRVEREFRARVAA